MRRFLDWVMGLAEAMGGPGLFLLAFLDSSFLSFPEVVDVLMIGLVAKYPERLVWYAAMPTIGSVAGSYLLYALARRGGEAFLRKRLRARHVDRALSVVRRYGVLAVAVPSILPPPVPFKIFVLGAGAARVTPFEFLVAVAVGRSIRYFGEAALAAWYGPAALEFLHAHGAAITLWLVGALVAVTVGWVWWKRRRGFDSPSGSSV